MSISKKISITLALIILLPIVAVLAINAFDEKLDPKLETYGMPRAPTVPDAQNGYYGAIGMAAPDGADAAAYAKAWVAEARAAARENRPENSVDGAGKRAKRPDMCDSQVVSCFAVVRAKPDEIKAGIESYREDLERYERLLAHTRYEEVLDYPIRVATGFPPLAHGRAAQRAYLMRAALAAEAGMLEDAVEAIARDIAFQRVMLSGSRTVIGKMVAASNYTRDLAFVLDLIQTHGAGLAQSLPRLRSMLERIDPAALQLTTAAEVEFAFIRAGIRDPFTEVPGAEGKPAILERIAFKFLQKTNATTNLAYRHSLRAQQEASAPAAELAAKAGKKSEAPAMSVWDYVNNPVGNYMLSIGQSGEGLRGLTLRLHDLDALNRLVGLRVEMLAAGVGAESAGDYTAKSDARFHDPYTQKPMAWDAAAKQLGFRAYGAPASQKRFNFAQGRAFVQF